MSPWKAVSARWELNLQDQPNCPHLELAVWRLDAVWSWVVVSDRTAVTAGGAPTRAEAMRSALERARSLLPPGCHDEVERELAAVPP